jgi:hypothetical protein
MASPRAASTLPHLVADSNPQFSLARLREVGPVFARLHLTLRLSTRRSWLSALPAAHAHLAASLLVPSSAPPAASSRRIAVAIIQHREYSIKPLVFGHLLF